MISRCTGPYVIARGEWPHHRRDRRDAIDVYARAPYFTATGNLWGTTPDTAEERQDALDRLAEHLGTGRTLSTVETPDLVPDPNAKADAGLLRELISGPGLRHYQRPWTMSDDQSMVSEDPSQRDWRLARRAVELGWPDQGIANLLVRCRRDHGQKPENALRPDYIPRTIGRARERLDARAAQALLPFKPVRLIQRGESGDGFLRELDDGTELDLCDAQSLFFARAFGRAIVPGGLVLSTKAKKEWKSILKGS